jgi:hypothetical protein
MKTKEEGKTRPVRTTIQDEKRIVALEKKTGFKFSVLVRLGLEKLAKEYGV